MTDPTKLRGKKRVSYFQGHYRYICAHHHIPLAHHSTLKSDGDQGPQTDEAVRELKRAFGVKGPVTAKITDEFLRMVRSPFRGRLFTPARRRRGASYRRKVRKEHKARLKAAAAGSIGQRAVRWGKRYVGKRETGRNDARWLRELQARLVWAGHKIGWMIPGNPYCGFGVMAIFHGGAKAELPDGTVYTPNILNYAAWGKGNVINGLRYTRISLADVREGDILPMHFGSGIAKHVATARAAMKRGMVKTREFNTSPGVGGSQANGDGCWDRVRAQGMILGAVRVTKA